MKWKKIFIA